MSLSVGIDIDNTICDSLSYWQKIADEVGITGDFTTHYNGIWTVKCPEDRPLGKYLFGEYHEEWLQNSQPYEGAVSVVSRMFDNPNINLYFVTSRSSEVKNQTARWLTRHKFPAGIPVIHGTSKLDAPVQVLVDDNPKDLKDFAENARMPVKMIRNYNKSFKTQYEVNDMEEFYELILRYV